MMTTVRQLIEQLERCDPDAQVACAGEPGVADWKREVLVRETGAGVLVRPGGKWWIG